MVEGGRQGLSQNKILMAVRVGEDSLLTPVLFLTLASLMAEGST